MSPNYGGSLDPTILIVAAKSSLSITFLQIFFDHKNIIKIVLKDTESLESSTKRSKTGVHILSFQSYKPNGYLSTSQGNCLMNFLEETAGPDNNTVIER